MTDAATIARTYGLKLASEIAPPTRGRTGTAAPPGEPRAPLELPGSLVEETPPRPRRTDAEIAAEKRLDHHWICLIGYSEVVPRRYGDNRGTWPVRVELVADWRTSGKQADIASPLVPLRRLAVVGVASRTHGARLKAALDEMLKGRMESEETESPRYSWRDAVDFGSIDVWWPELLGAAMLECELSIRGFEVFDREEHERRVRREVDRRLKGRR